MSDFGDIGENMLMFAQTDMKDDYLRCAGYGTSECPGGGWFNLVSGRALDLVDIEHWACKLCVYLCARSGSRLLSKRPNMWKPHCHPLALTAPELKLHSSIQEVAGKVVAHYQSIVRSKRSRDTLLAKLFVAGLDDREDL